MKSSLAAFLYSIILISLWIILLVLPSHSSEAAFLNCIAIIGLVRFSKLPDRYVATLLGFILLMLLSELSSINCKFFMTRAPTTMIVELFDEPTISPPFVESEYTKYRVWTKAVEIGFAFMFAIMFPFIKLPFSREKRIGLTKNRAGRVE